MRAAALAGALLVLCACALPCSAARPAMRRSGTAGVAAAAAEPNPPKWPLSVAVFGPADAPADIAAAVNAAFAENGGHDPPNHGQFSEKRFAFLFKPGVYSTDVPVGFYTQVLGLGSSPEDVTFTGQKGVYCEEGDYQYQTGALDTFWRGAENFATNATCNWLGEGSGMMWAVSQASPLRRVKVANDLMLYEYQPPATAAGYASGGYFSSLSVGGTVQAGGQQQWFGRNSEFSSSGGGWTGGVWNIVLGGVEGAPEWHCGNDPPGTVPMTKVDVLPVTSEKPFVALNQDGATFSLIVPEVVVRSRGLSSWGGRGGDDRAARVAARVHGFEGVYLAQPGDSAAAINAKLSAGLHVVLSPAVYRLEAPLELSHDGQVLLGLGLATLVAANATAAIKVGAVNGARVAGILVQAGPPAADGSVTDTLVEWGEEGFAGDPSDPGFIHDLFVRVGGPDGGEADPVAARVMVHVKSGHVIGDNLWLWRADHVANALDNACDHGLIVTGDDVVMYALAVEHTYKDLTQWSGERGLTYFYQSELPYGVTQEQWPASYAGYRVNDTVTQHSGFGVGVYVYFRDHEVNVDSAIVAPESLAKNFLNPLAVFLNGLGSVQHVLNGHGGPVYQAGPHVSYVCADPPGGEEEA